MRCERSLWKPVDENGDESGLRVAFCPNRLPFSSPALVHRCPKKLPPRSFVAQPRGRRVHNFKLPRGRMGSTVCGRKRIGCTSMCTSTKRPGHFLTRTRTHIFAHPGSRRRPEGLDSWRNGKKRRRAGYRLPPHSQTLPPGRRQFGVRWQAKRDTAFPVPETVPKMEKEAAIRCVCSASPPRGVGRNRNFVVNIVASFVDNVHDNHLFVSFVNFVVSILGCGRSPH